jgi:hypothetical protein
LEFNGVSKISRKVAGKPIIVGERTLIPLVGYSAFFRKIDTGKNSVEMVVMSFTVTPISVKVIQGDEEWVINITEMGPDSITKNDY